MALTTNSLLDELGEELTTIQPWVIRAASRLDARGQAGFDRQLLMGIYLQLAKIARASTFGSTYFRITPKTLTASAAAIKIIEREREDLVRKVSIWVDPGSGGPTPTIRISTGPTGTGGGGIRVNAGQVNELGEVPSNTELWGASTATINLYVIERA